MPEHLGVEGADVVDQAIAAELRAHTFTSVAAHGGALVGVVEQAGDAVGEGGAVAGRYEVAALAVLDDEGHAADVGGDDRSLGGEGFDERDRRALVAAREHDDVEVGHDLGDVVTVAPAGEVGALGDAAGSGLGFEGGAFVAVADDHEVGVGDALDGGEGGGDILDGDEAADDADEWRAGGDAEFVAEVPGGFGSDLEHAGQVEAEGDDVDLAVGADAEVEQLVADLGADGDDAVGAAGQAALGFDDRPLGLGAEV